MSELSEVKKLLKENAGSAMKKVIDFCNDYIENKNPWLPTGIKRKSTRSSIGETEGETVGETAPVMSNATNAEREQRATAIKNGLTENKEKNISYAKRIAKHLPHGMTHIHIRLFQ